MDKVTGRSPFQVYFFLADHKPTNVALVLANNPSSDNVHNFFVKKQKQNCVLPKENTKRNNKNSHLITIKSQCQY